MTRTLFLLRHAKSSWDNPTLADHDRPLAPRGRRACRLVADHLRREGITPALVLCSSSTRTRETLDRIAAGFRGPVEMQIEDRLYGATAAELLARLHEVGRSVESVMLIGHRPAIHDLALSLTGSGKQLDALKDRFPTATLATLSLPGDWHLLAPGTAELRAFVKPKELVSTPR